jgi:hypothetical protein
MKEETERERKSLPGVVATLSAGVDMITSHLWLVILPVLLDVFYWLGPRLGVDKMMEDRLQTLQSDPFFGQVAAQLAEVGPQINLFTQLTLPIIGIPTLMSGPIPETTPLEPAFVQLTTAWLMPLFMFGLTVLGLGLSAVYLGSIGQALRQDQNRVPMTTGRFLKVLRLQWNRLSGLCLVFLLLVLIVSIFLLPLVFLAGLINPGFGMAMWLAGFIMVAVYLSMAVPAIMYNNRPVLPSVIESFSLVRRHIMPAIQLLLAVVIITTGMNLLWHLADDGSWLTLVSIAGHSFISTALVAAIFIFYRDRTAESHTP